VNNYSNLNLKCIIKNKYIMIFFLKLTFIYMYIYIYIYIYIINIVIHIINKSCDDFSYKHMRFFFTSSFTSMSEQFTVKP
jgi:hypothetical protein